jgi:rRNA maturation endonuclease Nob1
MSFISIHNIIILAVGVAFAYIMQGLRLKKFEYQCRNCNEKFNLPTWKAVIAPPSMNSKLVKCPKCGKWTWANAITSK